MVSLAATAGADQAAVQFHWAEFIAEHVYRRYCSQVQVGAAVRGMMACHMSRAGVIDVTLQASAAEVMSIVEAAVC
jgi:hypothetical protein